MRKLQQWIAGLALLAALMGAQGCALFVVGAAVGAGAGTVSYVGNELRVTQEANLDRAWKAANSAMKDLEFTINATESRKDATAGIIVGRNAQNQRVHIQLLRQTDRLTEIRIRVGEFSTSANRAATQLLYDKLKARL